jgi:16S rRNA (guanine527-N7)-methyltransferase
METLRIAELLAPFTAPADLSPQTLTQLQSYLDLLLRWNARMNLTAVRDPEHIVTRHFGESLFAARVLLGDVTNRAQDCSVVDVGSGAGFPGIPIKLYAPEIELTLIESHGKKATFLREVVRTLGLKGPEVFCGRAEQWGKTADVVTLRAVEQFERTLPIAAGLVGVKGKLCLLLGAGQVPIAKKILGAAWTWEKPEVVPQSNERVVLLGRHSESAILPTSGRTSDLG